MDGPKKELEKKTGKNQKERGKEKEERKAEQ